MTDPITAAARTTAGRLAANGRGCAAYPGAKPSWSAGTATQPRSVA